MKTDILTRTSLVTIAAAVMVTGAAFGTAQADHHLEGAHEGHEGVPTQAMETGPSTGDVTREAGDDMGAHEGHAGTPIQAMETGASTGDTTRAAGDDMGAHEGHEGVPVQAMETE